MLYITIEDAGSQLAQLVDRVCKGEEIVIVRDDVPVAKIVPVTAEDLERLSSSQQGA